MNLRREPMSGVDAAWLRMDRATNRMQILGMVGLRGPVSLEALRARIARSFLAHPRFLSRPVEATLGAAWEEVPDFDLHWHVRGRRLPARTSEATLRRLLGELAAARFDPARPWWEFLLLRLGARRSVLVARIHHCYADGVALVRVVLGVFDAAEPDTRAGDVAHPAASALKRAVESAPVGSAALESALDPPLAALALERLGAAWRESQAWLERGLRLAQHPAEAASLAGAGLDFAAELAQLAGLPDEPATALRGALSGDKRLAWAPPFPLEAVRSAAHALGCTINDLLVAAASGALAAWLRRAGGAPARIPGLRAVVPVNLRTAGEVAGLGNRFGLVFLDLPVGHRAARERLQTVRDRMLALKRSRQPPLTLALLATLGLAPRVVETAAIDLLSRKASLVLSNVPGPRERQSLLGAPVESMMFWVPQSGNVGLGLSLLTCGGEVRFGVVADAALVPEPHWLARRFVAELRACVALAQVPPPTAEPAPRRRRTRQGAAAVSRARAAPRARR